MQLHLIVLKILRTEGSILINWLKNISMENKNFLYNLYYDWWKNIDKFIFSLILLLFFIGLFFSLASTSLVVSDKLDTNDYSFFFKHLIFILLGLILIFIFSSIDQEKLFKFSYTIFLISIDDFIVN